MDPWRIALCALSSDAQLAITDSKERTLKRMLAVSTFLSPDAAVRLLAQRNLHAEVAVRALDDPQQLQAAAATRGMRAMWAARNSATPPASLADIAGRVGAPARFWALCNESLGEDVRKRHLTASTVADMAATGGNNAEVLSRSAELVAHNWWMSQTPEKWPSTVRRAIALDPRADAALLQRVAETGLTRWPMLAHRPQQAVATMTTAQLVAHGGTTTALAALQREDLTFAMAKQVVQWDGSAEARVIGLAITRFGVAVADGVPMAGTKVLATSTIEPSAVHVFKASNNPSGFDAAACEAGRILGGDAQAWNVYAALAVHGHRDMVEMATAATQIV